MYVCVLLCMWCSSFSPLLQVSDSLVDGGFFIGCMPDGLRIKELCEEDGVYRSDTNGDDGTPILQVRML